MDYPKSVAGVGLVDGQFVDEDQVNGTPGSLIPAQWGNDVTEEILNVVREVGDEPAEGTKNQLVGAIWKMFRAATANATEMLRGVLRVGTQAEVDAGVLDDVAVTAKKLKKHSSIGMGQSWKDMNSSRIAGTTYTNTTGRPITVSVVAEGYGAWSRVQLFVEEVLVSATSSGANATSTSAEYSTVQAIIPNGSTYRVGGVSGVLSWRELR